MVQLLLTDPALAGQCGSLEEEDFSSPWLGKVYRLLREAYGAGRTVSLDSLSGSCEPGEIGRLAEILQRPASMSQAGRAMADYIRAIERAAEKRRQSADPLRAAVERSKEKKGYGGKRNE